MPGALVCAFAVVWISWVSPDAPVQPDSIKKVHIVQSNHLDVGFDDTALNIINLYFDTYFPAAVRTARELSKNKTAPERLVWMAQPYIVSLYLDCPSINSFPIPPSHGPNLNCTANPERRKDCGHPGITPEACEAKNCCWDFQKHPPPAPWCFFPSPGNVPPHLHCPTQQQANDFREALNAGHIVLHAFPFNAEPEVLDSNLFQAGLAFSRRVAESVGVSPPVVMSQRDVPGMTRAALPLLRKAGVIGINVGINTASAPAAVPSVSSCLEGSLASPFLWRDEQSGAEVIAAFHPGGYGTIEQRSMAPSPALRCACLAVPHFDEALCYAWRGDNAGPPSVAEIQTQYQHLALAFPNATVVPGSFDQFYEKVFNNDSLRTNLPVVTSEIGDTWVYGCSSDPGKLALSRLYMRERARVSAGQENPARLAAFDRLLLKVAEHTWGLDGVVEDPRRGDCVNWTNAAFEQARQTLPIYQRQEDTWVEQRAYLTSALSSLGNASALATAIRRGIQQLDDLAISGPAWRLLPSVQRMAVVDPKNYTDKLFIQAHGDDSDAGFTLSLDPTTGAIVSLREGNDSDSSQAWDWANASRPLGRFVYRSRDVSAGAEFVSKYQWVRTSWVQRVYEKVGLHPQDAIDAEWLGKIIQLRRNSSAVVAILSMPEQAVQHYGAPEQVRLTYAAIGAGQLSVTVAILNKTTTKLPEEAWVEFRPVLPPGATSMRIHKLGSAVDPTDVIVNGSRTLHAVDEGGVLLASASGEVRIHSLDAGLVSPGPRENMDLYLFPGAQARSDDGVAFSLWNNLWSVNYVLWYPFERGDERFGFRFVLDFKAQLNQ